MQVAEAKENAAQDHTTREPLTLTAGRASIPYSGSISLGSVNPIYQLSLKVKVTLADFFSKCKKQRNILVIVWDNYGTLKINGTTVIMQVAEAKENAAQDHTTREPLTLTAGRASIPYSGSISLGSVNPIYQLSLKAMAVMDVFRGVDADI
ncbi:hypothetical protein Nmel_000424 [Mimus melanotis]